MLEQGEIFVVFFHDAGIRSNNYLNFIQDCLTNVLITGVSVKFDGPVDTILFLTVSLAGTTLLQAKVTAFGGTVMIA